MILIWVGIVGDVVGFIVMKGVFSEKFDYRLDIWKYVCVYMYIYRERNLKWKMERFNLGEVYVGVYYIIF